MRVEVDEEEVVLLVESRKRKKVEHLASLASVIVVQRRGTNLKLVESQLINCGARSVNQKTTIQGPNGV